MMNMAIQPIGLPPMLNPLESTGFSISSLQQAISLQPSIATAAAGQTMSPSGASAFSLTPTFNPLNGLKTHTDEQMRQVSKNFEAIFMRMLFKEMRNSVQKSGIMGNSQAMDFFETMRDDEISQQLANSGGLGIGNMVYEKLKEISLPHQRAFTTR